MPAVCWLRAVQASRATRCTIYIYPTGRWILITIEEAEARALELAKRLMKRSVAILPERTIARSFGWVFYDAERFVLNGDESARLLVRELAHNRGSRYWKSQDN